MAVKIVAKAKVEIATTTDTLTEADYITSVGYDPGISTEDSTHLQSTVMEEIALLDNPTFTIEGIVDLADAAQDALRTAAGSEDKTFAYDDGSDVSVKITLEDETGTFSLKNTTIVSSYSESRDAKGIPTFSCTLKCNEAVTTSGWGA